MRANAALVSYRHCYVHVPFCARRCSYCDFAIAVRRVVPWQAFVHSLTQEWQHRQVELSAPLQTLYLGGGTPSSLGADGVAQLMDWMRDTVQFAPDAEITLEANPEDISEESVRAWQASGINRLSIGVQSFDDTVLTWMHRVHDSARALQAARTARDGGIPAFSVDLIFALPASLQRDWQRDLDLALSLEADHVSLYGLTVEPHTPLGRWQARGEVIVAPEENYEAQFLTANAVLTAAGYEHYEVSNFARPGKRAVHNSAYWKGHPYIGIGPSAHGYDGRVRRWNTSAFTEWEQVVAGGNDPLEGSEELTPDNRITEAVYLGLRTSDGLVMHDSDRVLVEQWHAAGWLDIEQRGDETRIRCTPLGWLRLDALASALTAVRSR